ncbi:MAG: YcnI family protein [Acidimicrobiia bacterium]
MGRRSIIGGIVFAVTIALGASTAGAHVSVTPSSAAQGGFQILSFSVPNEKDDANTVKLEVTLPTKSPIAFVSVKPMTGWTITTEKTMLAKPVKTDDGTITEAVSKITWTATAGGLTPGQFDLFTVSAGPLPTNTKKLVFKALQTYSDGDVVSWIEPTVKGTPEPEHPAPTLTLTAAAKDHDHS